MDIIIISLTAINLFLTYRMLNYIYNLDKLRGPRGPRGFTGVQGPMGMNGKDCNCQGSSSVAVGYRAGPTGPVGTQGYAGSRSFYEET